MATTNYGPGSKKETVYSGPSPGTAGTVYSGPTPQGTVGTVYQGPTPGGTVYRKPATMVTLMPQPDPQAFRKAGNTFFLVAVLSLVNTVLAIAASRTVTTAGLGMTRFFDVAIRRGGPIAPVIVMDLLVAAVFVVIGVFTRGGSKAACVFGVILYAGDTALLWSDGLAQHVPSIGVHVILLLSFIGAILQMSKSHASA